MLESYRHVFRYGKAWNDGEQRWAFRFAIVDPRQAHVRGRPRALANVFCAGTKNHDGTDHFFWTPREAAIECDLWKFYLGRYKLVPNLEWSLESYETFAMAYSVQHNGESPEDYSPSRELQDFLRDNDDVWMLFQTADPCGAWNPHIELHMAQKELDKSLQSPDATKEEKNRRYAILDWAKRFDNQTKLVREVEEYGVRKLEAEADMNVDLLVKAIKYAESWSRPSAPHMNLGILLDVLAADRKKIAALVEHLKATQTRVRAFLAKLPLDTEDLKKERIKL